MHFSPKDNYRVLLDEREWGIGWWCRDSHYACYGCDDEASKPAGTVLEISAVRTGRHSVVAWVCQTCLRSGAAWPYLDRKLGVM